MDEPVDPREKSMVLQYIFRKRFFANTTRKTWGPCPRCGSNSYSFAAGHFRRYKGCESCNYDTFPEKVIADIKWLFRRGRPDEVSEYNWKLAVTYLKSLAPLEERT